MGRLIGYARVSTLDQNPAMQHDALYKIGCDPVFSDHASGTLADRPGLARALAEVRPGDTLVVWKLDRLGRSLRHLVDTVYELRERDIGLRSLQDSIDTNTASGRFVFHVFCALADFERDLIHERTLAGLAAARARGRVGGRPQKLTPKKLDTARRLRATGEMTMQEIADVVGVSRGTLYRHMGESA
jgi:DNA invertase Pin-like site-specific DNA recombinase